MTYVYPHIEWLDRQPTHMNGYPKFMSDESICWLERKVASYLTHCNGYDHRPALWEIADHWTREVDKPDELRFGLYDAIYGVTHHALLSVTELEGKVPLIRINGTAKGDTHHYTVIYNHLDNRPVFTPPSEHSVQFRLYDDDDALYFSGCMSPRLYDSKEIFMPLDDTRNKWGCTRLDCLNPRNQKWEQI